jgi:hypothetical protein
MLGFASEHGNMPVDPLSLRNVSGDLCSTDYLASGVFDGRDRQRNINQAAILAATNGLIMVDARQTTNSAEDYPLLTRRRLPSSGTHHTSARELAAPKCFLRDR